MPSYYPNQSWHVINWASSNKLLCIVNQSTTIFLEGHAFEHITSNVSLWIVGTDIHFTLLNRCVFHTATAGQKKICTFTIRFFRAVEPILYMFEYAFEGWKCGTGDVWLLIPFYLHGLTLTPAWISNHMPSDVWYRCIKTHTRAKTDIHMYVNLQFIVAVASFTNMI